MIHGDLIEKCFSFLHRHPEVLKQLLELELLVLLLLGVLLGILALPLVALLGRVLRHHVRQVLLRQLVLLLPGRGGGHDDDNDDENDDVNDDDIATDLRAASALMAIVSLSMFSISSGFSAISTRVSSLHANLQIRSAFYTNPEEKQIQLPALGDLLAQVVGVCGAHHGRAHPVRLLLLDDLGGGESVWLHATEFNAFYPFLNGFGPFYTFYEM